MDLHEQSKKSNGPIAKAAVASAYGLDQVLDFVTGIFSSGAGNDPPTSVARISLNGLFGSQQGGVAGSPPVATTRETGLVAGASLLAPTLQPRAHSPGAPPPVKVDGSYSIETPTSAQEPLSPSQRRDNNSSARELLSPSHRRGHDSACGKDPGNAEQEAPRRSMYTDRRGQPYEACEDDLLDQHVAYYLRHHPETHALHSINRKRAGVYILDRREVQVEWQYAEDPGGHGFLVIVDGPLRQPFADYMEMTENNAEYDSRSCNRSSLYSIPREQRMSFHDQHKVYTRLEAMKVAKEQAAFREKHADYLKEGAEVPDDLMMKYKKTIQQTLREQPLRSDHGSKSPHRNVTPSHYVSTPPPEQFPADTGVHNSYTPPHVFSPEPMDYFAAPPTHGGSSMWGNAWPTTGPPHRSTPGLTATHNYGVADMHSGLLTPPAPPPSWQQGCSGNRSAPWRGYP